MSGADAIERLCEEVGLTEPEGWAAYLDIAQAWDARTDLTSARTETELAEILFLDAAQVIRGEWIEGPASLVDVGAGVGAPSIPILLANATLSATLVEPRRIRSTFLRTAAGALGLYSRNTVLEQKVDPENPTVEGIPFGIALSRATFAPKDWLTIGAQLADEVWVLTAGTVIDPPPGLVLARRLDYEVPSSGAPRCILGYRR
ncbi:MAG: class I SAM-dependent methyltransferase [Deltaproteobacteria bacterium]|nr:class I SAM-dependent methyltransferase [Deltaproteobacteria bacterium]